MIKISEVNGIPEHYTSVQVQQYLDGFQAACVPDAVLSDRSRLGPTRPNGMAVDESLYEAFEAGFSAAWAIREAKGNV